MKSSNPVFNKIDINKDNPASLSGIINKTIILFSLMILGACFNNPTLFLPAFIINIVSAITFIFKREWTFLAPIYAFTEGIILFVISSSFESTYPGIVTNSISATVSSFLAMLILYKFEIIKVNNKFRNFILTSMIGIFILYFGSLILSLFNIQSFIYSNSIWSIGLSVFVIIIASLGLAIDFKAMEDAIEQKASSKNEWYLSFGLILSIIWIYLEFLRLFSKLKNE